MRPQHFACTDWLPPLLVALTVSCNSSGSSSGASFGGGPAATTADAVVEVYTKETTKPTGEVTVQGVRKVKLDNLCKILAKNSDNNPVDIAPSKWRTTRAFLISHSTEINYFCSKYNTLGELFDAVGLDPKLIRKQDLKDSIASIADVMNGADVASGPKKILSTTPTGACDNLIKTSGAATDGKATKAATSGMSACAPGLTVGILLLNNEGSSLNNNLSAAAVACMALYGNLLKKSNVDLPQSTQSAGNCKSGSQPPAGGAAGGGGEDEGDDGA